LHILQHAFELVLMLKASTVSARLARGTGRRLLYLNSPSLTYNAMRSASPKLSSLDSCRLFPGTHKQLFASCAPVDLLSKGTKKSAAVSVFMP